MAQTKIPERDVIPTAFADAFARLARRTTIANGRLEVGTLRDYWTALQDVPLDELVAAADALARYETFFPAVAEWREAATAIATNARRPRRRLACARCQDMGLIKICYHSGELFDVAICSCRAGRVYRIGGERLVRMRLELQDSQQVADLEDVLAVQATDEAV